MDPFQTPGAVSWSELMTTDPTAASAFYGQLFGWKFDTMDMGMPYNVVKVGESAIGGIMGMPPGMPPAWVTYVTVTDVDGLAAKVPTLGGKVIMPPTDIPTVGRFAVIQDPQGAVINMITYLAREQ